MDPGSSTVLHSWKGWYFQPDLANRSFHGLGEIQFERASSDAALVRAAGRYWDVDEAQPERTTIKPVQFRRTTDDAHAKVMSGGNDREIRSLTTAVFAAW